jgi:hypothetical protein
LLADAAGRNRASLGGKFEKNKYIFTNKNTLRFFVFSDVLTKYIIDTKFIISMSAKRRRLSSSFKSDSSILVSVQTTNAVETIEIINNSETN